VRRICLVLTAMLVLGFAPLAGQAQSDPSLFTRVEGFATKTGFRAVFAWEASQPVLGYVVYGESPDALDRFAGIIPTTPDTAGMSVAHLVTAGGTYWYQVVDDITGQRSDVRQLEAVNAYNDYDGSAYTIDLLVQLDSKTLPAEIPADQALSDIAQGMRIMAERIYDATDGHAQVGKVLVTDTAVDHAVNPPFISPGCFNEHSSLADMLVQTTVPFDSHTWGGWAIAQSCTQISMGRVGQLVVPWEDDLHFGYTGAHELLHYAFNAPDLYGLNSDADCRNLDWDGSIMHNTGGWNGSRWELTELDRHPSITPCAHGSQPWSWQVLLQRYTQFPPATTPPQGVLVTQARGNEVGSALDIMVLDRVPGASTLTTFEADLGNGPVASCTDTGPQVVDAQGDATGVVVESTPAPNEASLDIVEGRFAWAPETETLTATITLDDLYDGPPPGATGRYLRYYFTHDSVEYNFVASQHVGLANEFRLVGPGGTVAGAAQGVTGAFDSGADQVRISLPAAAFAAARPASAPIGEGTRLDGFRILSQRYAGAVTPTADSAGGACPYVVGQEHVQTSVPTDLTLQASTVGGSRTMANGLSAVLTTAEDGSPIAGQVVSFYIDGRAVGEAVTDQAGRASVRTSNFNLRRTTPSAVFGGSDPYEPSSDRL